MNMNQNEHSVRIAEEIGDPEADLGMSDPSR